MRIIESVACTMSTPTFQLKYSSLISILCILMEWAYIYMCTHVYIGEFSSDCFFFRPSRLKDCKIISGRFYKYVYSYFISHFNENLWCVFINNLQYIETSEFSNVLAGLKICSQKWIANGTALMLLSKSCTVLNISHHDPIVLFHKVLILPADMN